MKMICNVPDEVIKSVRMGTWCGSSVVEKIIASGTPLPDNATNGSIIKSIFPNMRVGKLHDCIFAKDYKNVWFGEDWWNAPYQKGGKE